MFFIYICIYLLATRVEKVFQFDDITMLQASHYLNFTILEIQKKTNFCCINSKYLKKSNYDCSMCTNVLNIGVLDIILIPTLI